MATNHDIICPKCKTNSGDDWKQCNGDCPLPLSPHFNPDHPQRIEAKELLNKRHGKFAR